VFRAILSNIPSLIIIAMLIDYSVRTFDFWDLIELFNDEFDVVFRLFTPSKHFDKGIRLFEVICVDNYSVVISGANGVFE
jgi:hypothetical protein